MRRLIARPIANVGVAAALLVMAWLVAALPSDTLGDDALLLFGAFGAAFVLAAALALVLGVIGLVARRVRD